MNFIIFLCHP